MGVGAENNFIAPNQCPAGQLKRFVCRFAIRSGRPVDVSRNKSPYVPEYLFNSESSQIFGLDEIYIDDFGDAPALLKYFDVSKTIVIRSHRSKRFYSR